ncbi:MAG: hypothetical protein JO329_26245, partial [Planctomycetaceae bacterium]|nr:hypothetical protein [Planctomycetaceae bacterium]
DIDEVIRHATEARMVEWAAYVNSRYHVIVALAAMLGFSIITNIVFLTTRRP